MCGFETVVVNKLQSREKKKSRCIEVLASNRSSYYYKTTNAELSKYYPDDNNYFGAFAAGRMLGAGPDKA